MCFYKWSNKKPSSEGNKIPSTQFDVRRGATWKGPANITKVEQWKIVLFFEDSLFFSLSSHEN